MWGFLRQRPLVQFRSIRPYSQGTLTPSELRFKQKLEEAERKKLQNAPEWEKREQSLRKRYGQWNPTRKLSRQHMNDIRDLKARAPELKTVQIAEFFSINPESIRRILKSKWVPNEEERARQEARGEKRKSESLSRKLAELAQTKETLRQAARAAQGPLQMAKPKSPGHEKRYQNKFQKQHSRQSQSRDAAGATQRRWRKPFTEGVGDLLE